MITIRANKYNGFMSNSSWIYLHGQLEEINGFDLCRVEGLELPPKEEDFGIHDVITIIDGLEYPSKLYLWKRRYSCSWAGLVVGIYDTEGIREAEKMFNKKSEDV